MSELSSYWGEVIYNHPVGELVHGKDGYKNPITAVGVQVGSWGSHKATPGGGGGGWLC